MQVDNDGQLEMTIMIVAITDSFVPDGDICIFTKAVVTLCEKEEERSFRVALSESRTVLTPNKDTLFTLGITL